MPGFDYDLHNHSVLSKDGLTPGKRLIDIAAKRKLKGLGICDHDEFPDETLYDYAARKDVKLALGIEFSCHKAHIIGYDMKFSEQDRIKLRARFDELRENFVQVTRYVIDELGKRGIAVTYEEIKSYAGKEPQKVFILKYLAEELKLFAAWSEARRYLQEQGLYIPDDTGASMLHPAKAVEIIHRAGGLAVWAHPFFTPEALRPGYVADLLDAGLDGVEVSYAYRENGYTGPESNEELKHKTLAMFKNKGLIASGGSDSHYPVKTHADLRPIMPGDYGISSAQAAPLQRIFK